MDRYILRIHLADGRHEDAAGTNKDAALGAMDILVRHGKDNVTAVEVLRKVMGGGVEPTLQRVEYTKR